MLSKRGENSAALADNHFLLKEKQCGWGRRKTKKKRDLHMFSRGVGFAVFCFDRIFARCCREKNMWKMWRNQQKSSSDNTKRVPGRVKEIFRATQLCLHRPTKAIFDGINCAVAEFLSLVELLKKVRFYYVTNWNKGSWMIAVMLVFPLQWSLRRVLQKFCNCCSTKNSIHTRLFAMIIGCLYFIIFFHEFYLRQQSGISIDSELEIWCGLHL